MIDIEILSINSFKDNSSAWLVLPDIERDRANNFLKMQDSLRFKLGRLMVRMRLSKELGLPPEKISILINSFGKPNCSIDNSLNFSISHSGEFVAVGWSDYPIGVDIEPLTSILNSNLDHLIFNANEISIVNNFEIKNKYLRLIMFVAKEAVLKCLGFGFSVDPKLIELQEYEKPWKIISASYLNKNIFVKIIILPSGYLLGVASHSLDALICENEMWHQIFKQHYVHAKVTADAPHS